MHNDLLKKLGMNEKEVQIYLKLLEIGSVGVNVLAKVLDANRTSVYSILDSMMKRGFVSYVRKKGIKYFSAANPQVLINHFFESASQLKSILPELLAVTNIWGQKPKITFYEGLEGIKQICETLLEVPNSVRESFMGIDERKIHPEIKKYFETDFINRRIDLGIKYRGIVTGYMPMGNKHPQNEKGQNRILKFVDNKKFPINIQIDIFPNNKVALYSYNKDQMMGVIIEHEDFYVTMRSVFALAWAGVL